MSVVFGYDVTLLACAERGDFTARVYLTEVRLPLLHMTPGVILSDEQFSQWFPEFDPMKLHVSTTATSLYEGKKEIGEYIDYWSDEELKEFFQKQLEELVGFLHVLSTGSLA